MFEIWPFKTLYNGNACADQIKQQRFQNIRLIFHSISPWIWFYEFFFHALIWIYFKNNNLSLENTWCKGLNKSEGVIIGGEVLYNLNFVLRCATTLIKINVLILYRTQPTALWNYHYHNIDRRVARNYYGDWK